MNAYAKSAGDPVPDAPAEVNKKPEDAIAAVSDQTADVSSTLRSSLKSINDVLLLILITLVLGLALSLGHYYNNW
jgi:hypothetical protein